MKKVSPLPKPSKSDANPDDEWEDDDEGNNDVQDDNEYHYKTSDKSTIHVTSENYDPSSLDLLGIKWEWKTDEKAGIIDIEKPLAPEVKDLLSSYTKGLKDIRQRALKNIANHHSIVTKLRAMKNMKKKLENNWTNCIEADYDEKVLKWYSNEEMTEFTSWPLFGIFDRAPSSEKIIRLEEREVVSVGLWTANRAAIWLSAQDSEPLLSFINELDPHVYVL